ncbi:LAETG motif-containing sortase-dependent surface protein [Streptomyces tibetensis]|uniref:LAETG motif-containing sortase-dependent surface protein n=1 Tax=Streptomyces tibetensis TaxID=2382123 RepID=UPI0033D1DEC5
MPFTAAKELTAALGARLSGKVLVDISNPVDASLDALGRKVAPGAGTSPSPVPASDTDANHPTTNGDLAETGASSSTPLVAGGGLAVVVAGTAAVWFGRRRRTAGHN